MAAVLRTFLKDLGRFWPLAAAAFALNAFLGFFPDLGIGVSGPTDAVVLEVATAVRLLVLALAAVAVVHEDPVSSDRSAWITRPLGPWQLLAAKLLFLTVALAAPSGLCATAVSLRYHLGPPASAVMGLQNGLDVLLEVAAYACLASVTSSLLTAGIAFAGLTLAFALAQPYLQLAGVFGPSWFQATGGREALAMAVTLVALAYQYARRRLARAMGVAALAGMIAMAVGWAVSAVTDRPEPTLTDVTLGVEDPKGFVGAILTRPFPLADRVVVGLQVRETKPDDEHDWVGPPLSRFTAAGGINYSMSAPSGGWIRDGIAETGLDDAYSYTAWRNYPEFARAVGVPLRSPDSAVHNLDVLEMPAEDFERLRGLSGTLTTRFKINRETILDQGSLPLQVEASSAMPGRLARIESVSLNPNGGLQVVVHVTDVVARRYNYRLWALVNDRRNEVSLSGFLLSLNYSPGSYLLRDHTDQISFQRRWTRGSQESNAGLDPSWLKDARLVFIDLAYASPGSVDLSVPGFVMPKVGGAR